MRYKEYFIITSWLDGLVDFLWAYLYYYVENDNIC